MTVKIGIDYNLDVGSCCPRRVTVIGFDETNVYFQTRDLEKHIMEFREFESLSYPVGGMQ